MTLDPHTPQCRGINEVLARIGNDEFAMLLQRADAAAGCAVAEAVLADFQTFSFPWGSDASRWESTSESR